MGKSGMRTKPVGYSYQATARGDKAEILAAIDQKRVDEHPDMSRADYLIFLYNQARKK